ncbi:MAG: hypothetical protein IT449_00520 [Phycisphaerales bacterium]|nr:hypothetical protein [Phycisphaerales bacterium]
MPIGRDVRVAPEIVAREGFLVAGRVCGTKSVYNQLEDVHGRMVTLHDGDTIVGVLGHRNALHGYSGYVPNAITAGERLQLLNLGGVIGACTSQNPEVGKPFDVEILGAVLTFPAFEDRSGVPAHIGMNAIALRDEPRTDVPVVIVAGTCMNSGKTAAASRLIRYLSRKGLTVGGCKLTGVSLRRDTLSMMDYGAKWAVSFTDAGVVTTSPESSMRVARGLVRHLADAGAQAIVAELGDGILGEYGVQAILGDAALMNAARAIVMCANDPVGSWGAQRVMRERFQLDIDVITGPATDNAVGTGFVERELGLTAINARTHPEEFGAFVAQRAGLGGRSG